MEIQTNQITNYKMTKVKSSYGRGKSSYASNHPKCKSAELTQSKGNNQLDGLKIRDPTTCCLREIYHSSKEKHRLKVKELKMIYSKQIASREKDVAYVYQTKQFSRQKKVKKEKDGHLKMIKGDNPPRRHNIY